MLCLLSLIAPGIPIPHVDEPGQALVASATCTPPCTAAPSVHGDPIFKYNGKGTHFWLKPGQRTPLVSWSNANSTFALEGRTFADENTGKQWFNQLVAYENGQVVLAVDAQDGVMMVKHGGETAKSETELAAQLGGLDIGINPSLAKLTTAAPKTLLNLKFGSMLPDTAQGIFAELTGLKPVSQATRALLKNPATGAVSLAQASAEGSNCICPTPTTTPEPQIMDGQPPPDPPVMDGTAPPVMDGTAPPVMDGQPPPDPPVMDGTAPPVMDGTRPAPPVMDGTRPAPPP